MQKRDLIKFLFILLFITAGIFAFKNSQPGEDIFLSYEVNPKKQDLKIFWKDDKGEIFKSIGNLKKWVEAKNKTLVFATNGGMYKTDNSPLGLFIDNGKTITALNRRTASGNFYWKPNGVLYIDSENNGVVVKTENFINNGKVKYATQSGPMLVYDGKIHPEFKQGSINLNIRNGVGVLPNNNLIFVMSKQAVNLYDFANYFKKLGCKNALSFDGFVCRTYLPGKNWVQTDGNFGPIIGVTINR